MYHILKSIWEAFLGILGVLFERVSKFFMNIFGISSEIDLVTNEVRKALFLLSLSFLVFFVFSVIVIAILLTPSKTVVVPDVVGDDIIGALVEIGNAGLVPNMEVVISEDKPRGIVVRQIPSPGNIVREGKSIKIFVSLGSGEFVLPDFTGKQIEELRSFLASKGVYISSVEYVQSEMEQGTVIKTYPSFGSKLKPGSQVVVYVSSGPQVGFPMPNMVGFSYDKAMLFLDSKGVSFKVTTTQTTDPANDGVVLDHLPREDEFVSQNVVPELFIGVFGDENVVQNTRFVLYKVGLRSFSKADVNTYYIRISITDSSGNRRIDKTLNNLSTLVLPLKVRGVAKIQVFVNEELVREDTI
ncbi:MAG: PASTA domain-containing protein [Spirochaetia bacterium]|nr:PASTA domain-containing protein [Spirochaetota bacterium]MCX8096413.1 PASTA domain-containing protein [Spirochaetota bacterium]MDW8112720.1 PASTA domain-containing protein [Spirochaetia bacterium]